MNNKLLHKYLNGDALTEKELQQVEQAVESNPELLTEAERIMESDKPNPKLLGKTKLALRERERHRLRNKLQDIERELEEEKKTPPSQGGAAIRGIRRWRVPMGIAATLVLALGAIWLYNNSNDTDYEQLFAEHDSPYNTESIRQEVKSYESAAADDKERQQGLMLELTDIFDKDKAEYLSKVGEYRRKIPLFDTQIAFMEAVAQKETGDSAAQASFEALAVNKHSYQDDAYWQLALIHLSKKEGQKVKEYLSKIPEDSEHYGEAQKLLDKL